MKSKSLLMQAPDATTRLRLVKRRMRERYLGFKRVYREPCLLCGGPFNYHTVQLGENEGGNTLPFTVNGQSGRYVNGTWEPTP